jgi:NADP-dependent 3-hydroxy acid dehydrogenase YdfG
MTDASARSGSRYAGKVAVVTGGASGIGEAIVRRLLAEGASVVAGDVNTDRLELLGKELGEAFHGVRADVRAEEDVTRLVAETGRFGPLDVAFNVAGLGKGSAIIEHSTDDWKFVLDVCLNGVFLAMKHEGKLMTEGGRGGAILNISSLNSEVPMFGGAAALGHQLALVLHRQEHAVQADVEDELPVIGAVLDDRAALAEPGDVKGHVERPEPAGLGHQPGHVLFGPDVGPDPVERLAKLLAEELEAVRVDVACHHRSAFREEPADDCLADAGGAAGHHRDLARVTGAAAG